MKPALAVAAGCGANRQAAQRADSLS